MKSATIIYEITPDRINARFDELHKKIEDLEKNRPAQGREELMSRKQVAEFFDIDLSTLYHWCKKRKLQPYGLGNRIFFKRSEVESAIKPITA